MPFAEELARIRNRIYHVLSSCFFVTRDDLNRFIRAVGRVFERLRCNNVDTNLEECVVEALDVNSNNIATERRRKLAECKNPAADYYTTKDPVRLVDEVPDPIVVNRAGEVLSNVTIIQVQPYKRPCSEFSSTADDQQAKPSVWRKAKRALVKTLWRGPRVPQPDVVIEDLEDEPFWSTMNDANLVM